MNSIQFTSGILGIFKDPVKPEWEDEYAKNGGRILGTPSSCYQQFFSGIFKDEDRPVKLEYSSARTRSARTIPIVLPKTSLPGRFILNTISSNDRYEYFLDIALALIADYFKPEYEGVGDDHLLGVGDFSNHVRIQRKIRPRTSRS